MQIRVFRILFDFPFDEGKRFGSLVVGYHRIDEIVEEYGLGNAELVEACLCDFVDVALSLHLKC